MDGEKREWEAGCKREGKEEGDQCHTAESLLWRGERDGGRTGRTNRWRGDKKKGRPARGKGYPFSLQMRNRGVCGEREITEKDGGVEEKRRDVIRG